MGRKRYAKACAPGCLCRVERVGDAGQNFRGHAPAVVGDENGEGVGSLIALHGDVKLRCSRAQGIFGKVKNMQRKLFHGRAFLNTSSASAGKGELYFFKARAFEIHAWCRSGPHRSGSGHPMR